MKKVRWTDDLLTGVTALDGQHVRLFTRLNELAVALHEKRADEVVRDCLRDFIEYATRHISFEESIMEAFDYPEEKLVPHRKEHEKFAAEANAIEKEFTGNGHSLVLYIQVSTKLAWTLRNHFLTHDREMAIFLRQKTRPPAG